MLGRSRILVIDDSELVLRRVRLRLEAEGYEVVATSQVVGIGRLLVGCDLCLIDFHMPGIDGADVLRSLRAASHDSEHAPLFYLYSSDRTCGAKFRMAGFDGAIGDKGDDDALVEQVDAALRIVRLKQFARRKGAGR